MNFACNLPEATLQHDFAVDRVVTKSGTAAVMYYTARRDAEKALQWHRTAYKGRVISVMWSKQW